MITAAVCGVMCTGHYVAGVLALMNKTKSVGVPVYWAHMVNKGVITRVLNELARIFIEIEGLPNV